MKLVFILTFCLQLVLVNSYAQFIPAGSGSGGTIPPSGRVIGPGTVNLGGTPIAFSLVIVLHDQIIVKMASLNRKKAYPEMKEDFKNIVEVINFVAMENASNFVLSPDAQIQGQCNQEEKSPSPIKSKVIDNEIILHLKRLVELNGFPDYLINQYDLSSNEEAIKLIESINRIIVDFSKDQ